MNLHNQLNRNHNAIITIFLLVDMLVYVLSQNALENLFYSKCLEVSSDGEVKFKKLRYDAYEMGKYFPSTFKELPQGKKHFCSIERNNLNARIDAISKDLEPCLHGDEKFLSPFLKESFKEFLHFLCHNNAENIDKFFGIDGRDCRDTLERTNSTVDTLNCFSRIFPPLNRKIAKKDLCDSMGVAKKCLATAVNTHCPNNIRMKELNEDFFRYTAKPCAGCNLYFNFLVLIFCNIALFSWK